MPSVLVLSKWVQLDNGDWWPQAFVDYPGEWADATGQADADIHDGLDRLAVRGTITGQQLVALQADANYVVLPEWGAADLNAAQVSALKGKLEGVLSGDMADLATKDSPKPDTIVAQVLDVVTRPPWREGEWLDRDTVRYYQGNLYAANQAHRTQADWTPDSTTALYRRFHEASEGPQPFVHPTGAHDTYAMGIRVIYKGQIYESTMNDNAWSPDEYPAGWKLIGPA